MKKVNSFFKVGTTSLYFVTGSDNEISKVISKSSSDGLSWNRMAKSLPNATQFEVNPLIREEYLDQHQLSTGFAISIVIAGNKIYGRGSDQSKIHMIIFEENEFPLVEIGGQLSFQMGENGVVTSLTPHRNGHHLGKKIENQ